jgi:hypothetical protein
MDGLAAKASATAPIVVLRIAFMSAFPPNLRDFIHAFCNGCVPFMRKRKVRSINLARVREKKVIYAGFFLSKAIHLKYKIHKTNEIY